MPSVTVKGGDKWKAAVMKIANQKPVLRVGILEGATNKDTLEPIAPYAFANEFGGPHNPPRHWLGRAAKRHGPQWVKAAVAVMQGNPDKAADAFEIVGQLAVADIKADISNWDGPFPNNSEETVIRKYLSGRKDQPNQPLIDSGSMLEAVSKEIVEGK